MEPTEEAYKTLVMDLVSRLRLVLLALLTLTIVCLQLDTEELKQRNNILFKINSVKDLQQEISETHSQIEKIQYRSNQRIAFRASKPAPSLDNYPTISSSCSKEINFISELNVKERILYDDIPNFTSICKEQLDKTDLSKLRFYLLKPQITNSNLVETYVAQIIKFWEIYTITRAQMLKLDSEKTKKLIDDGYINNTTTIFSFQVDLNNDLKYIAIVCVILQVYLVGLCKSLYMATRPGCIYSKCFMPLQHSRIAFSIFAVNTLSPMFVVYVYTSAFHDVYLQSITLTGLFGLIIYISTSISPIFSILDTRKKVYSNP